MKIKKLTKKRIKLYFDYFVKDYLDWAGTLIRMFWTGCFSLIIIVFTQALLDFIIWKSGYVMTNPEQLTTTMAWGFGLIYFFLKMPIVSKKSWRDKNDI